MRGDLRHVWDAVLNGCVAGAINDGAGQVVFADTSGTIERAYSEQPSARKETVVVMIAKPIAKRIALTLGIAALIGLSGRPAHAQNYPWCSQYTVRWAAR